MQNKYLIDESEPSEVFISDFSHKDKKQKCLTPVENENILEERLEGLYAKLCAIEDALYHLLEEVTCGEQDYTEDLEETEVE